MPRKGLHNFAMTMLTIKSREVTRTGMFLEYQCAKHLEGLVCTISAPAVSSMWVGWSVTPVEDLVPMFHWGQSTTWRQPQCQTCALDSSLCIALKCESYTKRKVALFIDSTSTGQKGEAIRSNHTPSIAVAAAKTSPCCTAANWKAWCCHAPQMVATEPSRPWRLSNWSPSWRPIPWRCGATKVLNSRLTKIHALPWWYPWSVVFRALAPGQELRKSPSSDLSWNLGSNTSYVFVRCIESNLSCTVQESNQLADFSDFAANFSLSWDISPSLHLAYIPWQVIPDLLPNRHHRTLPGADLSHDISRVPFGQVNQTGPLKHRSY